MSARDDIFANIRRSLGVSGKETTRHAAVAQRLADTPRGPIPARGQGSPAGRLATFIGEATRVSATVVVLDTAQAVPEEIARFLRDAHLPLTLKHGEVEYKLKFNCKPCEMEIWEKDAELVLEDDGME